MIKRIAVIAALSALAAPLMAFDHHAEEEEAALAPNPLSTLLAAVAAAELVETFRAPGPYTVFAPTNEAFGAIQGTVDTLLEPDNRDQLQRVLTAHVVEGVLTSDVLAAQAEENGGSVTLQTVSGDVLIVAVTDAGVTVQDEKGGRAAVLAADVPATNGTIHLVDAVLVPNI